MTAQRSLERLCREAVQRVRARLAELAKERGRRDRDGLAWAAQQLGISRQAVALWKDRIPFDRVYDVAKLTGIPPSELRPDKIGPRARRYRGAENGKSLAT